MTTNNNLMLWLNHNPQRDNKKAKIYSDGILHQLLKEACPELALFEIKRTENGKPYIDTDIDFSYSHSRRSYLYAVTQLGPIGLDIECTDKIRNFMTISKRYFHADEYQQLKAKNPEDRRLFFYRLWTRKEAWCKLCGGVLWYYLGRSVLENQQSIKDNQTLYLTDLTDIQGYAGASATVYPVHQIYLNTIK